MILTGSSGGHALIEPCHVEPDHDSLEPAEDGPVVQHHEGGVCAIHVYTPGYWPGFAVVVAHAYGLIDPALLATSTRG